MASLAVRPSYQLTEEDILTVDKINLMATPVVDLSIETTVSDINYFRNGNFYSAFWTTPAGISAPAGVWTSNADFWSVRPTGAAINYLRSTDVPDLFSLFSAQLVGATGVGIVEFGAQINGDLSASLRRVCTFSGYIKNTTGAVLHPTLNFYTCNAFNNFNAITLQVTIDLQSVPNTSWMFVSATQDISLLANAANGLLIAVSLPAGSLTTATQTVNFSRMKFQQGEIATEFSDDPSLFVETTSVDSTMLQDGCIARPSLFLPNVIPQGAFVAGAIQTADIGNNQVTGAKLTATAVHDSLGYTPVNKAGDTGVGPVGFTQDTPVNASGIPAIVVSTTSGNASNPSFDPAIGLKRPGTTPIARYIGLAPDRRFRTMDDTGVAGFLLDTITGVDINSYQNASITYAKLAQSLIDIISPIGMVICYAGPNPPAPNWLICDGTAYGQSVYPALYAKIGTYWGAGTGGQQFQVPDFRGRAPIGYVNTPAGGITGRAFASRGGEENHVLNTNELAFHNHTLTDGTHSHTYADPTHSHQVYGGWAADAPHGAGPWTLLANSGGPGRGLSLTSPTNITINASGANIAIAPVGGNAGHNTMMPFAVAYYFIRAL